MVLASVGTGILWVGWYGFNAGSALAADGIAANAFLTTTLAGATASLVWPLVEFLQRGKPSVLGFCSGAVAGLVGITPACGFVDAGGAVIVGAVAGLVSFIACTTIKRAFRYDDTLDVFGVHGIGGIVGAIGTGIVADPALGGQGFFDYTVFPAAVGTYDMAGQVLTQIKAVGVTVIWTAIVSAVLFYALKFTIGLRPSEEAEREGLDLTEHGERAYNY
jgi:Amt family ammonium transporter